MQCGSIALAVVMPKTAATLQLGAVAAIGFSAAGVVTQPWPVPVAALIVFCTFLSLIGLRQRWPFTIAVWWVSLATFVAIIVLNPVQLAQPDRWGNNLLIEGTSTLLVLAGSVALGQRRRIRDQLAEARRDVELEQASRRLVEERGRIARELHDVVAHSMSIVHFQATSAKFRIEGLDPLAAAEFDDIARSARMALREMRQLPGALRPKDDGVERSPQPQLADLTALTVGPERVGTHTVLNYREDMGEFTPVVQLTIYRIVQEALSNAVRHAPNAKTVIDITETEDGTAVVSVRNEASANALGVPVTPDRGGMGLRGMRERVALLGGLLIHETTADGGFRVVATIPPGDGE